MHNRRGQGNLLLDLEPCIHCERAEAIHRVQEYALRTVLAAEIIRLVCLRESDDLSCLSAPSRHV